MSSKSGSRDGAGPSNPKEGVQGSNERGRRGSQSKNIPRIDYELDLHGLTVCDARKVVKQMFRDLSNSPSEKTFKVITGRGLHSVGGIPVIRNNIEELLRTLHVKVEKTKDGGAFYVTILARTELILSDDEGRNKQVHFPDFCQPQLFKLKGASISNAQALVSHSGMDVVVRKVNAFVQEIRCREREKLLMPILKNIFGEENDKYYLSRQDLIAFWEMKAVDATLISTYMRYLDGKYENREIIEFVNPASISTTDDKEPSQRINKRLGRRKNSQLCFFPFPYYFQSTFHWVLMVIDCSSMVVYWVDSLHGEPDDSTKNNVMNWLDTPLRPTWKFIRGPKQTDSGQSGYSVMKCMRELMCETSQSIKKKMDRLDSREDDTPEESDDVTEELMGYVE